METIKAVGYVRASTDKQQLTCQAQREKVLAYAAMKGLDLVEIIEDEATTSRIPLKRRTEGERLMKMLSKGEVQAVVVAKLDRAFRKTTECLLTVEEWDKSSVQLHIIDFGGNTIDTSTATGKLMITFLAGMAEWERGVISERTKAVLASKRQRGEKTGGAVPYGATVYTKPGVVDSEGEPIKFLSTNQAEAEAIEIITELKERGHSLRAICSELEKHGIRTKKGGAKWQPKVVSRILKRAAA